MSKDYKGYDLFTEDSNRIRTAWNRTQTVANIKETLGDDDAQAYFEHFDNDERYQILFLLEAVNQFGKEQATARVLEAIEQEANQPKEEVKVEEQTSSVDS